MLPVTLQYPFGVQRRLTQRGAKRRVVMGSDGVELDSNQKCPLIFFILRYIKHYTYIYLNIYIVIHKLYTVGVWRNLKIKKIGFIVVVLYFWDLISGLDFFYKIEAD